MPNIFFNKTNIFFIGIGGIGVSALAKLALMQGAKVSGVDLARSEITDDLKKQGAKISITNNISRSQDLKISSDLVIYSTAVPFDNPILTLARKLKIPAKTYPQVLGKISKSHYTIAVSGMHGKSTTTAMIGLMLESAGLDPLVIVGTKVKQWHGNIRIPKNKSFKFQVSSFKKKIFVVEADEYKSAMLNLSPDIIVLTRIEEDHLDYYKNLTHIKREFRKYLKKLTDDGCAVVNWKDENIQDLITQNSKLKTQNHNLKLKSKLIKYNYGDDYIIAKIKKILKVPGKHNLENGLAAYKVGKELGLTEKQILKGLAKFQGTWRRMETVGELKIKKYKLKIISDYAHHPTEIKATLQALHEKYPGQRILLAYQPHQHNRTKKLFADFITAFDQANILILNEIFDVAGREENIDQDVSSRNLVREIKKRIKLNYSIVKLLNCYYAKTIDETKKKILELARADDIIVIMGAGDIDLVARELIAIAPRTFNKSKCKIIKSQNAKVKS